MKKTSRAIDSSRATENRPKLRDKSFWTNDTTVFQLLLAFRIVNAISINTFFQPDEYYQALEPAWRLAFGKDSAAWITWEWRQHLRSAIHPTLFALAYRAADLLSWGLSLQSASRSEVLLAAPKLLQSLLAATADYQTWKLAELVFGGNSDASIATLFLVVLNPWQWFVSTRTFSNCLETTLTISALRYWPWDWLVASGVNGGDERSSAKESGSKGLRIALLCAATATILRPTNVLIWITVAVYTLAQSSRVRKQSSTELTASTATQLRHSFTFNWSNALILIREASLCGSFILILSVLIDRFFYGSWVFPPYNFLHFNVFQSLALFYGNNNWHYYLTEGYPLLLTTSLPYAMIGMIRVARNTLAYKELPTQSKLILKGLSYTCIALPVALSLLSHKEVRFIYPILPCIQIIAAQPASELKLAFTRRSISAIHIRRNRRNKRLQLLIILPASILISWYTSRVHNSGLIDVTTFLRQRFETHHLNQSHTSSSPSLSSPVLGKDMTLAILMPCHSFPWRSHLHHPPSHPQHQPAILAWALTCEPPLHLTDLASKATYKDEADLFYENPRSWLKTNMARKLPVVSTLSASARDVRVRKRQGIFVDRGAQGSRNKKLWEESSPSPASSTSPFENGLDITDLLPHLITSPPSSNNTTATASPKKPTIRRPWPSYLVFFSNLESTLTHTLNSYGPDGASTYRECWRGFNSVWHDDWRRKGDVVVWCLDFGDE